jgi:hypothetical protein
MEMKTSIELSSDLYRVLDRLVGPGGSLIQFVESVLRDYLNDHELRKLDASHLN